MRTVIIAAGYGPNDPPTQNTCRYFVERGWRVVIVVPMANMANYAQIAHVNKICYVGSAPKLGRFASVYEFLSWRRTLHRAQRETKAELLISFMFHPWVSAGSLPSTRRATCIYDIPPVRHAGTFARHVYRRGWHLLKTLDFVWSSDVLKAGLCRELGGLSAVPPVCHNVPYADYIADSELGSGRAWLQECLLDQGLDIRPETQVLLRAGAFGVFGGIEETLEALVEAPDWIFVLMGRPDADYEAAIRSKTAELGLSKRVGYLVRPNNEDWRRALLGADAGHLIHLRPAQGYHQEVFGTNSPLSTNRLYQYMAASIPILSYADPRMKSIHTIQDCFGVVDTNNVTQSIVARLKQWSVNRLKLKHLGTVGRQAHMKAYNWETQFSPIYQHIQQLTEFK